MNEAFASNPNYREVSKHSVISINFILVKINAKKSVINKMSKKCLISFSPSTQYHVVFKS